MRIKSNEREPFIQALQKLRPDLEKTVSELDDQLGVLRDDIADLLGRLQHTDASPESEAEGRDAQGRLTTMVAWTVSVGMNRNLGEKAERYS